MIGNKKVVTASILFALWSSQGISNCEEYHQDAEAYTGVVPKFHEDGSLRAMVTYGEATFLAPKRSLVGKARERPK